MAPDVFPEGILLLDKMMGLNGHSVPTAAEALSELRLIKTRLNPDALQFYLPGSIWIREANHGVHFSIVSVGILLMALYRVLHSTT